MNFFRLLIPPALFALAVLIPTLPSASAPPAGQRPRVIIETDAGGDPDDEQSLVRFLLYTNDLDVEGIIANRPTARDGENLNPVRTGYGIVLRQVDAYAACYPRLREHDPRYPAPDELRERTVAAYGEMDRGVDLIIREVDRKDPRPIWFCDWGTDDGSTTSSLKRALDRVLRKRGPAGYARFKNRIRLSSADAFGEHTGTIEPPFKLWVDTFRPELDRRRWYHRFSAITAKAGGFDIQRDVLVNHGPLGAMYPLNTTHPQKEGDTMAFLYLVPTGMNDPEQPDWGSWGGRYGKNETTPGKPYYWSNRTDAWNGVTNRDNTLLRWAAALQNDFRARLDWCVQDRAHANHPPTVRLLGDLHRRVRPGATVRLDASRTSDPDGQPLRYEWIYYPEPGTYRGPAPDIQGGTSASATLTVPVTSAPASIHLVLAVTDTGSPALTRYARVILDVAP